MAFAQGSTTTKDLFGTKRVRSGGFTQANGDTGGTFNTGLQSITYFECTGLVTASVSGGTVTATTLDPGAAQTGYWMAIGK